MILKRNNLRIFERKGENTDRLVLDVAKKLGINLTLGEIDRSHRTGKPQQLPDTDTPTENASDDDPRPRPILVKFATYRRRHEIISQRRKLKNTISLLLIQILTNIH